MKCVPHFESGCRWKIRGPPASVVRDFQIRAIWANGSSLPYVHRTQAVGAGAPRANWHKGGRVRGPSYFSASTAELFFAGIYRHVRNTQPRLQYLRIGTSHAYLAILHSRNRNWFPIHKSCLGIRLSNVPKS